MTESRMTPDLERVLLSLLRRERAGLPPPTEDITLKRAVALVDLGYITAEPALPVFRIALTDAGRARAEALSAVIEAAATAHA